MNIPDFTTVQWIGIGFAAWCIASPFLGVLIGKWLARCAARHPLHDLSDKQADFASLDIREGFGGVEFELSGSIHSGANNR
jgi:hypothetical protein